MKTSTLTWLLAFAPALSLACGANDGTELGGTDCAGAKCDSVSDLDPSDFACADAFVDASKRADKGQISDLQRLDSLGDPFAEHLLKATEDGCVLDFNSMIAKLEKTESDCDNDSEVVSDAGQYTDKDGKFLFDDPGYRVVTSRGCSGDNSRPNWHMFLSLFGASNGSLPQSGEAISFDEEEGVFNFYVFGRNGVEWHGNSRDAVEGGNRCGNCHNSGSAIQKELNAPWVHWEPDDAIAGADDFFTQFGEQKVGSKKVELLGNHSNGDALESVVTQAARAYAGSEVGDGDNATKVGYVPMFLGEAPGSEVDARALLQPLFCTNEINLQSGGTTFGADFFFAKEFNSFSSRVSVSDEEYKGMTERAKQTIRGLPGVDDTKETLTYPERAMIDATIVDQLKSRGVVDQDLVDDVLMLDFTQPLWSTTRCDLLDAAVDLGAFDDLKKAEDFTADAVRAGLLKALDGSEAPGADELIASLKDTEDKDAHKKVRDDFIKACNDRKTAEGDKFLDELMMVLSNKRNRALEKTGLDSRGPHNIIEDPSTMLALDELDSEGAHFDATCHCVGGPAGGICDFAEDPAPADGGDSTGGAG